MKDGSAGAKPWPCLGRRQAQHSRSGAAAAVPSPTSNTSIDASGTSGATCAVTPTGVVGPYPSLTDLMRSDIREGKSGTPLTLTLTVVNTNSGCAPVAGADVEIWQCDATGNYSQYAQPHIVRPICGASRPPTATDRLRSRRSTRAGTKGAPRTSTSKSCATVRRSRSRNRVSRICQQRGVRHRRLRAARVEPDQEHRRWHFRGQHQFRAGVGIRRCRDGVERDVPDRRCSLKIDRARRSLWLVTF